MRTSWRKLGKREGREKGKKRKQYKRRKEGV